jgi:hypothetical protein
MIIEIVNQMSLEIDRENRIGRRVISRWHLEKEYLIRHEHGFCQLAGIRVKEIAISQELAAKPSKDQDVFVVSLGHTCTLSIREQSRVYFD